jgi:hypothetical protein
MDAGFFRLSDFSAGRRLFASRLPLGAKVAKCWRLALDTGPEQA